MIEMMNPKSGCAGNGKLCGEADVNLNHAMFYIAVFGEMCRCGIVMIVLHELINQQALIEVGIKA